MTRLLAVALALASTAAQAAPYSFYSSVPKAGQPIRWTVNRADPSAAATVVLSTKDNTAVGVVDFLPTNVAVSFAPQQVSATLLVPTYPTTSKYGQTLRVGLVVSANGAAVASALASIVEPAAPAPPAQTTWVAAPLQDGSFARVTANDGLWAMTGPGAGRPLVPGEIVAVYFNGWGYQAEGLASFAVYALSDKTQGRVYAKDLEGVAPVGSPPTLPADWWVPGLVTANKTCTDPRAAHLGEPGVTRGEVYRAAYLVGTHMKLAAGQVGSAGAMWQVFGSGDQNSPATMAFTVVTGDCLTGQ